MASDPLPFNLHDQLEPLECNSRQTRRGSASPQSAHTSSLTLWSLQARKLACQPVVKTRKAGILASLSTTGPVYWPALCSYLYGAHSLCCWFSPDL